MLPTFRWAEQKRLILLYQFHFEVWSPNSSLVAHIICAQIQICGLIAAWIMNIDLEWVNNALKLRYKSIFQKRVIWNATNISDHPTHFWPIFLFHLFNSFHCFLSISCFYPIYHPFHLFTYLFLQWSFTRAHLKADGTTQNHALQIIYFVASLKLIIKLQWGNKFNNAL